MKYEELHKANAIYERLQSLKDHLNNINTIIEGQNFGRTPIFTISTAEGFHKTELKFNLLPIDPEAFLRNYKGYLEKDIAKSQKEFNEL